MLESLKRSPIKIGIILVVLILLNAGGWYLYLIWDEPFNESLNLPTLTEIAVIPSSTAEPTKATPYLEEGDTPTATPEITLTPTIVPVCGAPPSMTVLIAGIAAEGYLFGLADSVRIAHFDFQRQQITLLALPRDLWVDINGTTNASITKGKLNQAYFYGTEGMGYYNGPGYGSGLLAETLQDNFGLRVDRYVAVNLYAFREIVDAIGGIDVYLPEDINTKWFDEPKLFLKAGQHHLTGKQAEKVVRARIVIGDLGRIRNQTLILKAVAVKMLTVNGVKQLPDLVNRLSTYVLTDFSPSDISMLTCLAAKIDPQKDIVYQSIPDDLLLGEWVLDEYQGYQVYALTYDKEVITKLLADFQAGTWPEQ
jgi:LCP family protein required for cell wall assembly